MLNPLRSEQEAFRFLIYVIVVAAVIVGIVFLIRALCERRPRAGRARGARGRRGAAQLLRRPPAGVSSKSSATDLVSDADREAERSIRELLAAERPDDGLVAEEGSRAMPPAAGAGS